MIGLCIAGVRSMPLEPGDTYRETISANLVRAETD